MVQFKSIIITNISLQKLVILKLIDFDGKIGQFWVKRKAIYLDFVSTPQPRIMRDTLGLLTGHKRNDQPLGCCNIVVSSPFDETVHRNRCI